MEMNATDLMVGDWVTLFDKYPAKVEAIGDTEVYLLDDDGVHWHVGYEHIKPIPLTAEILEKNGFSFCTRDGGYYLYATMSCGFDVEVILFDVVNKYASIQLHIGDTDDTATYIHLMECNYIHQLQHALKLVGIDKEITI